MAGNITVEALKMKKCPCGLRLVIINQDPCEDALRDFEEKDQAKSPMVIDLGAGQTGNLCCRSRCPGPSRGGTLPGRRTRRWTNRPRVPRGTIPMRDHEDHSPARSYNKYCQASPNTTQTRSQPCHTTHTRWAQTIPPDSCKVVYNCRMRDDNLPSH